MLLIIKLVLLVASMSMSSVNCQRENMIIVSGSQGLLGLNHGIYWAALTSETFTKIPIQNIGVPEDVTYDPIDNRIYWIETTSVSSDGKGLQDSDDSCTGISEIFSVGVEGGPGELLFSSNMDSSHACSVFKKITIDIELREIFWVSNTADGTSLLQKINLNSKKYVEVKSIRGRVITDVVLDSKNRKIYWSVSYISSPEIFDIQRMNMDGTQVEPIIDLLFEVSGLTLDNKGNRLFLTKNVGYELIRTVDLGNLDTVRDNGFFTYTDHSSISRNAASPQISDTDIYWIMLGTGSNSRKIFKLPLDGYGNSVEINTEFDAECLHIHRNVESPDPNAWNPISTSVPEPTSSPTTCLTPHKTTTARTTTIKGGNIIFESPSQLKSILIYAGFGLLLLLVICLVIMVIVIVRRQYRNRDPYDAVEQGNYIDDTHPTDEGNQEAVNNNNDIDHVFLEKEIDRNRLEIAHLLGKGHYGLVYKAYVVNGENSTCVALKTLPDNVRVDVKERFLQEIKLHIDIGSHPNILSVLGCVTISDPLCMITEFMRYGDLLNFLWKCNKEENIVVDRIYNLTDLDQLHISRQIAHGMEYLSTTRFYHGDLAARNILVGEDLVIKISDFGMADDIYTEGYKRIEPEKKRPVKWVSLETNISGRCTIKSDVWSYGIVLYEIYTLGGTPYPGMTCREVIVRLKEGYRMEQFDHCPDEIYDIMRRCWLERPVERPTFTVLLRDIGRMIERITKGRDYQNVCETESERPASEISNDDAFLPPSIESYVKITKNEPNKPRRGGTGLRVRVTDGYTDDEYPDEHKLWKHLTKERTASKTSNASVEFVPDMEDAEAHTRIVLV